MRSDSFSLRIRGNCAEISLCPLRFEKRVYEGTQHLTNVRGMSMLTDVNMYFATNRNQYRANSGEAKIYVDKLVP